jgi:hypothetical protein
VGISVTFFKTDSPSIEKVHILRITHFSETTKDRNLMFGMGGDANVKLCINHFSTPGLSPTSLGNGLGVRISTIKKFTSVRVWGMTPQGLSYKVFNLPSHPDHKYIWFRGGDLNH